MRPLSNSYNRPRLSGFLRNSHPEEGAVLLYTKKPIPKKENNSNLYNLYISQKINTNNCYLTEDPNSKVIQGNIGNYNTNNESNNNNINNIYAYTSNKNTYNTNVNTYHTNYQNYTNLNNIMNNGNLTNIYNTNNLTNNYSTRSIFKSKNYSASVGRTPLDNLKKPIKNYSNTYKKNYNIVNPVERGRSISLEKQRKVLKFDKKINKDSMDGMFESTDRSKFGSIEIYKQNKINLTPRKMKDKNYYIILIQKYWRKYKQNKIGKEHNKTQNKERACNLINTQISYHIHSLKMAFFKKLVEIKPKLIEVTKDEYNLIQYLKEMGITTAYEFKKIVSIIIKNSGK